jgi:diguanylate cyclase (GGDEF)-like protein
MLEALVHAQREVTRAAPSVDRVLATLAAHAQQLTGSTGAAIGMLEGDRLVYRAACGRLAANVGVRLPLQTTLARLAVASCETQNFPDAQHDPRSDGDFARIFAIHSLLVVPLVRSAGALGVLEVVSELPNAFDGLDAIVLELLSAPASVALIPQRSLTEATGKTEEVPVDGHDSLTGLPSHRRLVAELGGALARARRAGSGAGLILTDIDGFNGLNGRYGHAAGDAILREAGRRLTDVLRAGELCVRYGDDEFAILLYDVASGELGGPRAVIDLVLDRIDEAFRVPFTLGTQQVLVELSTGVAMFPEDAAELDAMLARAYNELAASKRSKHPPDGE